MKSNWNSIIKFLQQTNDDEDMSKLLDFLFTLKEKHQVLNRYALAQQMIIGKKTQRKIAKDLGISISTVTHCSNVLKVLPNEIKLKFTQHEAND